ncbi:hypothetical protein CANCADRAFT_30596 [Tortispora caseinolytica NRRL Y-17796]|uniref:ENTH domain-containing protein n=1 Tax=Tortispora caseinolytica NRRL Y-17796 TaxID=767744 RepID=A0A1E4TKZ5_9ASCO|nr:hypothetical protein CANCADRAFT_30596 [Tortispora caseinolytica NRRL Y-17796]
MAEIAELTFDTTQFFEIMDIIDRRLNDKGKNWRHVMKALTLLDYILHAGSENVVRWSKDNLYIVKTLREFQYIEEDGTDQGANIRSKAKSLTTLLQDDERLREERARSKGMRSRIGSQSRDRDELYEGSFDDARERRRGSRRPTRTGNDSPNNDAPEEDEELERALAISRATAAEEDRKRRTNGDPNDEDLQKALKLSEEEEALRRNNNFLFDQMAVNATGAPPAPVNQNLFDGYTAQPQPMVPTGYIQQAYAQYPMQTQETGMYPQYTAQFVQQQQPQVQQFQPQFTQQPGFAPQPFLDATPTGSNNPFAQVSSPGRSSSKPTLAELAILKQQGAQIPPQTQQQLMPQNTAFVQYAQQQSQQQQQEQQQPQRQQSQISRPSIIEDNAAAARLETLLAAGDGIDTFGNTGDLRVPAQHTAPGGFINSQGTGYNFNGTNTTNPMSNPFLANQPTGYGFGGSGPQMYYSNQAAQQQSQQQQNANKANAGGSLIDI